jgi:hypothetical protein
VGVWVVVGVGLLFTLTHSLSHTHTHSLYTFVFLFHSPFLPLTSLYSGGRIQSWGNYGRIHDIMIISVMSAYCIRGLAVLINISWGRQVSLNPATSPRAVSMSKIIVVTQNAGIMYVVLMGCHTACWPDTLDPTGCCIPETQPFLFQCSFLFHSALKRPRH